MDDPTVDPRWGKVGKQTIADAGPLPPHPNMDPKAKFSMEDVDDELVRRSVDFMDRSVKANKPFFLWHNSTRTHVWTHLSPKWQNKSGYGLYADAMMELDAEVGSILKKIDDLGIADNTIVVFTSDNGAETFSWPDGGNSPFRGEKGTTFEGGFRVPMVMRWPGTIKPGQIINDIIAGEDFLPTFVAAAGDSDITAKLLNGLKVGEKTFKTHLDGYNFMPFFKGEVAEGPRKEFFYFTDNGDLTALRYGDWKLSFKTIKGNLFTGTRRIHQRSARHQPAAGPVGALPGRVDDVCALVGRQAVDDGPRREHRRRLSPDVQGISAEPGRWIVEHREGASNGSERSQRRRQMSGRRR